MDFLIRRGGRSENQDAAQEAMSQTVERKTELQRKCEELEDLEASRLSALVAFENVPERWATWSETGSWQVGGDLDLELEELVAVASEVLGAPEGVRPLDHYFNRLSRFLWCARDSEHLRLFPFQKPIEGEWVEFRLRRIDRVATAMARFLRTLNAGRQEDPPIACPPWLCCSLAVLRNPDGEYRTVRTPKEEWKLIASGWISMATDRSHPQHFLQQQMEVWPQPTDLNYWAEELNAAARTIESVDNQEAYNAWRNNLPPGARVLTAATWTPTNVAKIKRMAGGPDVKEPFNEPSPAFASRQHPPPQGEDKLSPSSGLPAPGAGADEGAASAEPWNVRLKRAREDVQLTRPAAVLRLKQQLDVSIVIDTIRKNEEGRAKPRPPLRAAYKKLYSLPDNFTW